MESEVWWKCQQLPFRVQILFLSPWKKLPSSLPRKQQSYWQLNSMRWESSPRAGQQNWLGCQGSVSFNSWRNKALRPLIWPKKSLEEITKMPELTIANTSPLCYLHRIGHLDVLHKLYGKINIPKAAEKVIVHCNKNTWQDNRIDMMQIRFIMRKALKRGHAVGWY